jgi:hypothetical protein
MPECRFVGAENHSAPTANFGPKRGANCQGIVMRDALMLYLVDLASDIGKLTEFMVDPKGAMTAAGLPPEDQEIMTSSDQGRIYAHLKELPPPAPAAAQPPPQLPTVVAAMHIQQGAAAPPTPPVYPPQPGYGQAPPYYGAAQPNYQQAPTYWVPWPWWPQH